MIDHQEIIEDKWMCLLNDVEIVKIIIIQIQDGKYKIRHRI